MFPNGFKSLSSLKKERPSATRAARNAEKLDRDRRVTAYRRRRYNPDNDQGLEAILQAINGATSVMGAQDAFVNGTGHNINPFVKQIGGNNRAERLNLSGVKKNLCAMARVINDIPALRGVLSGFYGVPGGNTGSVMETMHHVNKLDGNPLKCPIDLRWNANENRSGKAYMVGRRWWDKNRRRRMREQRGDGQFASSHSFDGAHEMGHVAAAYISNLVVQNQENTPRNTADEDAFRTNAYIFQKLGLVENFILQDAIAKLYSETNNNTLKQNLGRFIQDNQPAVNTNPNAQNQAQSVEDMAKNLNFVSISPRDPNLDKNTQGMDSGIKTYLTDKDTRDTSSRMLNKLKISNYTSGYGAKNHKEVIAEAFADVYQNGKAANDLSKNIVEIVTGYLDPSNTNWNIDDLFVRGEDWIRKARNSAAALTQAPASASNGSTP